MANKLYYTLTITGLFGGQVVNVQHPNLEEAEVKEEGVTIVSGGNLQTFAYNSACTYSVTKQDGLVDTANQQ